MTNSSNVEPDVVIIGGGLSGLATAHRLHNEGRRVLIIEAASRIGGRIHTIRDPATNEPLADLGPSWIWPPYQKHAANWVRELGLELHPQYETGMALLDFDPNQPPRTEPMPGQHCISRISQGPSAFIDAIEKNLPANSIHLNTVAKSVELNGNGAIVVTNSKSHPIIRTKTVVIATPLRIAASTIQFKSDFPTELKMLLERAPTWMAAQAKATILYEKPFWRDLGLSGRIASQLGPMVEAHDICGKDGSPAALFGFIGLPAHIRANNKEKLKQALEDQLVRCFGAEAQNYKKMHIEDWAENPFICTSSDRDGPASHPTQLPDIVRAPHWNAVLHFAVAETAIESPGLIDGALESAERVSKSILQSQIGVPQS